MCTYHGNDIEMSTLENLIECVLILGDETLTYSNGNAGLKGPGSKE
jgi:hypothetical protein